MNIRQMLEVTALISAHSSNLIERGTVFPQDALQRYWSCSRARSRIWIERLDAYPLDVAASTGEQQAVLWERTSQILSELFVTELVTRVWGGVLTACDRKRTQCDAELIARNVLMAHLASRNKALQILVHGPNITLEQASQIDALRRRVERWTDLLLGHLVAQHGVQDFAIDVERSLDFGETQLQQPRGPRRNQVWQLYVLCLSDAFPEAGPPHPLHERFRLEIVKTMLACFPAEVFHADGPLQSTWLRLVTEQTVQEGPPDSGVNCGLIGAPQAPSPKAGEAPPPLAIFSKLRRNPRTR